jgi:hypothetical protein
MHNQSGRGLGSGISRGCMGRGGLAFLMRGELGTDGSFREVVSAFMRQLQNSGILRQF